MRRGDLTWYNARVIVTPQISLPCEERAQVERLLADPLFSQSKRYVAFLRYVTERALSNGQVPLTERHLGGDLRAPIELRHQGKHIRVKGEHDATLRDLRESPAVILGGLNNQWTARLVPQSRFSFEGEGTVRFIRDKKNPASRQWQFDSKVRSGNRDKDLIIISRVSDSLSGRVTVLAGGFSAWGTEAAVELLTDPNQMQTVLARAPLNWKAKNVQFALECTVVNLEPSIPRLLAADSW
ncbi:hypothetical protein SBA3_3490020 [Candidatus Sulfopaludibacter sp. SbA3]|nr:hypothetical protein SBA3_3490020 [Candidatus Sulfopaludibacter sp. SbA3]